MRTKRLTLFMALLMTLMCCLSPVVAQAEPGISNEITVTPAASTSDALPTEPDLSLSLALTPESVSAGSTMVCSVTLANQGTAVTGQTVFCQLPAGLAPANPELLSYDPVTGLVRWVIDLAYGQTTTLAFDLVIPTTAAQGTTYAFTATAGNLTAGASAFVIDSDLSLNMTSKVKRAEPGDAISYTITLANAGTQDVHGLTVVNSVPAGMLVDVSSIDPSGTYANGQITWTTDLPAGAVLKFSFLGIIPDDAEEGDVFVNIATAGGMIASASVTVYEPKPILTLSKKVNNRTPGPDTTVKYTITVKNSGGADAYDVRITDTLPADLDIYKKSISHSGDYDAYNSTIVWYVDVPAFDSVSVSFKAYVPDYAEDGDVYVNRARIRGGDSAKVTMIVTEDAVPKTGYDEVVPAAWSIAPVSADARSAADNIDIPLPPVQDMFQELYEQNNNLVGWLKVSDQVDLPIAQAENNDYYMIRNFDGADDEAGALFLDERNHLYPRDQHLLIYGHNMKSGAMFGQLQEFRALDYLKANPVFSFQSIYDAEPTQYVIIAVLDASMDEGNKDYLKIRRPNFDDEADAVAFLESIKGFSYFNIPVEVDETDSLLNLVTCSYLQDNGRLLVIGRALREGETLESVTALMAETTQK